MTLSPPLPAQAGQPYYLYFEFFDYETGVLTDPATLTLDLTYGEEAGFVADIQPAVFPATYDGASTPTPNDIWRTGEGQYAFWWQVPTSGLIPGVYVANWTATYGAAGDSFLSMENFPIESGAPFQPVVSGDFGYFTGSLTYQPSWSATPFVIPLGAADSNGTAWAIQKITGWDSPPTVGSVIQRSSDHGGWPAAQFLGPRIITLTVMASAPTQALRDVARAQLQQAVAIGTSNTDLTTFVYNEPVPKMALVRRNGSAAITETYPTLCDVIFTIPLVAPDPRKYAVMPQSTASLLPAPPLFPLVLPFTTGLPQVFPATGLPEDQGAFTAVNSGTFETRPQITVTGPITGPQIINATAGQGITFSNLVMAATDVLTLDTDTRQSFLNGAFYAADPASQWWVIEPGTSTIYLAGATLGGAGLTMTYSSAWI
jgi:hypothetical protein